MIVAFYVRRLINYFSRCCTFEKYFRRMDRTVKCFNGLFRKWWLHWNEISWKSARKMGLLIILLFHYALIVTNGSDLQIANYLWSCWNERYAVNVASNREQRILLRAELICGNYGDRKAVNRSSRKKSYTVVKNGGEIAILCRWSVIMFSIEPDYICIMCRVTHSKLRESSVCKKSKVSAPSFFPSDCVNVSANKNRKQVYSGRCNYDSK